MLLRRGTLLFVLLMFSLLCYSQPSRMTKAVYCTQSADGALSLQRFEPLINSKARHGIQQTFICRDGT